MLRGHHRVKAVDTVRAHAQFLCGKAVVTVELEGNRSRAVRSTTSWDSISCSLKDAVTPGRW